MDKTRLRRQIQKRLLELTVEQRAEKSKRACSNLVSTPQFRDASTIMLYLSLPHEVATSEAILHAWQMGKIVAVPRISWQQRHMIPLQIHSLETGFSTSASGLQNPVAGIPRPLTDIDLVVAPGLGFDHRGNRLGRGGSFYDRFFAHQELRAVKCGLAFAEQQLDSIPVSEHDKPVDFLVTDEEVTYFNHFDKDKLEQGG